MSSYYTVTIYLFSQKVQFFSGGISDEQSYRVYSFQVAGRVLDCDYHRVGRDLSAVMDLDSDIYNPVYRYRLEVREDRVPPTATLLLKVRSAAHLQLHVNSSSTTSGYGSAS